MHATDSPEDHETALRLILEMQSSASTACAYLGRHEAGIREDLENLDQDWRETLRVSRGADGRVDGAVLIEWDTELDRSWVHGPWTRQGRWEQQAPGLLESVIAQAPVARHEMYAAVENAQMAWLAERCGWAAGEANFEYAKELEDGPSALRMEDDAVRRANPADVPRLAELHEAEFPGTYASTSDLVEHGGSYSTFVHAEGGGMLGYLSGQMQEGDTLYVDFLAVAPDARRRGIARGLLDAAAHRMGARTTTLTVDEHRPGAQRAYEALGFSRTAATRPYRRGGAADRAASPRDGAEAPQM
ncbi:GNAT family N-acetyltransferase [Brachybacterium halotolerans subsp. kimchii]|uniref:GNAT family N-acetyltransferase n=1 Tax=Brachybacterium halotolerans TaxID=2795215 RepID=UPI001E48136F|nr:GNAT family N-acetyltransferase [Brachybacterium halotolerans]UEJ84276.1 GNAT family N-acetyltransferase [Brachybacterium halotolerans subsp. kimchii]